MSMIVHNNMSAVRTLNLLNQNSSLLQQSLERVSSGQKINSAKDDAASFAISEKMREQIRSLDQDTQNIQNASSLIKVAEGAVSSTVDILKTIKEKAIDAANDTNTDSDRATIQKEIDQFMDQVNDNALVTFNGKYLIDGSTSEVIEGGGGAVDEDARDFIIKGLASDWVQSALSLINDSFGLTFDSTTNVDNLTPGVTDISVAFENDASSGNLAYVTHWSSSGNKASKLQLTVNMAYYNNIDTTNENGYDTVSKQTYLDRVLAHEFTHAAMAANIADFDKLPKWFKEGGSAELVHGVDDSRAVTMKNLLNDPTTLKKVLDGDETAENTGDNAYAAGYMIMRYMLKETVDDTNNAINSPVDVVKTLMKELANTSGSASDFDAAISKATGGNGSTGGIFNSKSDLITKFMNVVNNPGNNSSGNAYDLTSLTVASSTSTSDGEVLTFAPTSVIAFMKDKFGIDTQYFGAYNGTQTYDSDTGAVTGSDAGGSATAHDAEGIVPESNFANWALPTGATSLISGLTVHWSDGLTTDISSDGNSFTYGELVMTEKKLTMQTGTKANQATNIGFYDMRTQSMGTQSLINASKSIDTDTGVYDAGYFVKQDDENKFKSLANNGNKMTDAQKEWLETLQNAQNKTLDDISVTTKKDANIAIRVIDGAIDYALNQQTDIGSYLQRFDYTGSNVTTMSENIQSAESTIRDTDMAKEMTNFTKNNVLVQAAQSMLAQANQSSSAVLSLLQ